MATIYDQLAQDIASFGRLIELATAIIEGPEGAEVVTPGGDAINTFRESLARLQAAADAIPNLPADLASSEAGKGASLVSLENGLTLQQYLPTDNLYALLTADYLQIDGLQIDVAGFYSDSARGGGRFIWDASADKAEADGANIIDPDNIGTLSASELGTYHTQQGTGTGTGCFVRSEPANHVFHWGVRQPDSGANSPYAADNAKSFDAIYRRNPDRRDIYLPASSINTTHPVVADRFMYRGVPHSTVVYTADINLPMTALSTSPIDLNVKAGAISAGDYYGGFYGVEVHGLSGSNPDYGFYAGSQKYQTLDQLKVQYAETGVVCSQDGFHNLTGTVEIRSCTNGFFMPYSPTNHGKNANSIENLWVVGTTGYAFKAEGESSLVVNHLYIEACSNKLLELHTCRNITINTLQLDGCTLDSTVGDGVGMWLRQVSGTINGMSVAVMNAATPKSALWGFRGDVSLVVGSFVSANNALDISTAVGIDTYLPEEIRSVNRDNKLLLGSLENNTANGMLCGSKVETGFAVYGGGSAPSITNCIRWYALSYPLTAVVKVLYSSERYAETSLIGSWGFRRYAVRIKEDNTLANVSLLEEVTYDDSHGVITFSVEDNTDGTYGLKAAASASAVYTRLEVDTKAFTRVPQILRPEFYP